MKSLSLIILSCIAWTLSASGQYSYFNLLYGQADDFESEGLLNIESHPSGYVTYGGGVDTVDYFDMIRLYDDYGALVSENVLTFSPEFVYTGATNSFKKVPGLGRYLLTQGSFGSPAGSVGFAMMVDEELDTLWTRRYQLFDQHTYFFTHFYTGETFLLAGQFDQSPGENGSFIAEMDLQGDILWQQVVHEPSEGVYRMSGISEFGEHIVTTGSKGVVEETVGVIDILDSETLEVVWNIEPMGNAHAVQFSNSDKLMLSEVEVYADFEPFDEPFYSFAKINILEVDIASQTTVLRAELFSDYELVRPFIKTGRVLNDGSITAMGTAFKPVENDELDLIGFLVRLDSEYQVEWYTELRFDDGTCTTCASHLWDMEPTADGGYVGAGYFIDYAIDGRRRSWLIKVDACGDVVYNGCGAEELSVGMEESEALEDSGIRVYPNPSSDVVHIEMQEVGASVGIILRDLQGREILRSTYRPDTPIDIATLPAGSYLIEALHDDGSRIGISVIEIVK